MAAGGPRGTGGVGARNGVLVTRTGLVFHAGGDGKVRAYDEDTGKELWAGTIPGSARGIPAMYMAGGRQVPRDDVFGRPGRRWWWRCRAGLAPELPAGTPRGYIAFALPRR